MRPGPSGRFTSVTSPNNGGTDICVAAAAYDGKHLFIVGPATVISGVQYPGSIQEVDPATGTLLWQTPVAGETDGSPSLNGSGILSVATFGVQKGSPPSADYLVSATTGSLLATLNGDAGAEFAQPVFSGPYLLLATVSSLTAYQPPGK